MDESSDRWYVCPLCSNKFHEVGSKPCRSVSQGVAVCNCLPKTAWPPTYVVYAFGIGWIMNTTLKYFHITLGG